MRKLVCCLRPRVRMRADQMSRDPHVTAGTEMVIVVDWGNGFVTELTASDADDLATKTASYNYLGQAGYYTITVTYVRPTLDLGLIVSGGSRGRFNVVNFVQT